MGVDLALARGASMNRMTVNWIIPVAWTDEISLVYAKALTPVLIYVMLVVL